MEAQAHADLAAFRSEGRNHADVQVLVNLAAPDIEAARRALGAWLVAEPGVMMAVCTDGIRSLAMYDNVGGDWLEEEDAVLPGPAGPFSRVPSDGPT